MSTSFNQINHQFLPSIEKFRAQNQIHSVTKNMHLLPLDFPSTKQKDYNIFLRMKGHSIGWPFFPFLYSIMEQFLKISLELYSLFGRILRIECFELKTYESCTIRRQHILGASIVIVRIFKSTLDRSLCALREINKKKQQIIFE